MVTGLHRQILFRESNRQPMPVAAAVGALIYSVGVTLIYLASPKSVIFSGSPFLMNPASYLWILVFLWPGFFITALARPLRRFFPLFILLVTLAGGYLESEVVFRLAPPSMPLPLALSLGARGASHLLHFFFHRLYHLFPLCAGLTVFLMMGNRVSRGLLSFGDLSAHSQVTGGGITRSWKAIVTRFILVVALVLVVMIIVKGGGTFRWALLTPVLIYAFWNCLVEEILFRGMMLGSLEKSAGPAEANGVQAVLFALFHLDPARIIASVPGLVIYGFLGWFFGRAARETGGIGAGFLMHTAIVTAIELKIMMI